jgi:DNA invertase Pin-like site-specific DNA recombinase
MKDPHQQKVTADHLKRDAYLYVRQSTLRQVCENTESKERQYALRQRAVALGWPLERIIVIDKDLGQSGASAVDREGFQRLVAEVGMGRTGIVLGLEVSRLARNSSDWHRLLEICALTDTLILDEDGVYDPSHFNDRLLLGLKGAMSEAELHVLRARLRGGALNKAGRGDLKIGLPVGLVYDSRDRVVLDPDQQVQQAIRLLFETYRRTGTACAVVKHFNENDLLFPNRVLRGVNRGALVWRNLVHSRTLSILHNPRYAGAYVYGRFRTSKGTRAYRRLPEDQWHVLLPDTHPGYITWQEYQENQRRLRECSQAYGRERRKRAPGEGPALLQGLAVCGCCGHRMAVRYHRRSGGLVPDYVCQRNGIEHGLAICQSVPGSEVDKAIGRLLLDLMTSATLEVSLAVLEELQKRHQETDQLRRKQVERARYEVELARQRYMQVDPNNRLVADALEGDWNERLRDLNEAQEKYEQQRELDRATLDDEGRRRILELASDFPRLWHDSRTSDQQRKRMVRLLLEDVTLTKEEVLKVQIRFKGGASRELKLPRPRNAWQLRQTDPEVIEQIDRFLDSHTDGGTAEELNRRGFRSGEGLPFDGRLVAQLRRAYHLKSRHDRLRQMGKLTQEEMAERLDVSTVTIRQWRRSGLLTGHAYNDKNECLYDQPSGDGPRKEQGRKRSQRARPTAVDTNSTHEVHHAT